MSPESVLGQEWLRYIWQHGIAGVIVWGSLSLLLILALRGKDEEIDKENITLEIWLNLVFTAIRKLFLCLLLFLTLFFTFRDLHAVFNTFVYPNVTLSQKASELGIKQ